MLKHGGGGCEYQMGRAGALMCRVSYFFFDFFFFFLLLGKRGSVGRESGDRYTRGLTCVVI